jgi:protein involved in polysaccharide export with SLBB domain
MISLHPFGLTCRFASNPLRLLDLRRFGIPVVSSLRRTIGGIVCAVLVSIVFVGPAAAQRVPSGVQEELDRRGLTPDDARKEALRLGIDLTDPEAAVRRAREIGVPENLIREMLAVIEEEEQQIARDNAAARQEVDREVPIMFGPATVSDPVLVLPEVDPLFFAPNTSDDEREEREEQRELEREIPQDTLLVRVPLRDELSGIRLVEMFLLNEEVADTLFAFEVRRVLGSKFEGNWQGLIAVPFDAEVGDWTLFVLAVDESENDNIIETDATVRFTHDAALAIEADSMAVRDSLPYFGYDLFALRPETFEPVSIGPVDEGYLVGPGDELRLIVFGATEFQQDLLVDDEGRIFVPSVGQRTVAGSRLDDLREDLRIWLSKNYAGLTTEPPEVLMDLSVARLRPVNVFVLGEVPRPGRYPLPSNSSVFNALYAVGGPLYTGSLRQVQVVRRGRVAYEVDLYEYLLRGFSEGDVRLQSSDNIFIPPRGITVTLEGMVHRPAIYELRPGETFPELLAFAGGLLPEAYTRRFQIERVVPFAEREDPLTVRKVLDFSLADVLAGTDTVAIEDGDRVTIFSIPEVSNLAARIKVRAVSVGGAVFHPGRYELSDDLLTVRDLIGKADGLTGDAYPEKVELIRLTENLKQEVVSLSLPEILADSPTQNLVLRPQDSLYVFSLTELRTKPTVSISGQVQSPGRYELLERMTVIDLLFKGGGLADPEYLKSVFLARADLFRKSPDGRSEEIVPFDLDEALRGGPAAHIPLQPEDEIRVYPLEVEVLRDRFVEISGAVKREGQYRFRDGMSLEDLLIQAGGFRNDAYYETVEVTRLDAQQENGKLAIGLTVSLVGAGAQGYRFSLADSAQAFSEARKFTLQHQDRVYVRTNPSYKPQQTVTVSGEVRFPGEYTLLRENETLSEVIRRAGGVLPTGYPKGSRLFRDKLQVIAQLDRALLGVRDADIVLLPGDEITIPSQPNTVAVRGNVAIEGLIKFEPGRRVKYYLSRAGGLRPETEAVLLTQASGATFRVRRGLFKSNPVVDEGAQIFVTKEPPRDPAQRIDVGRTIVEAVGIISSTLTIVVLARQAFK